MHTQLESVTPSDMALLELLTAPTPPKKTFARRYSELEPLMLAAVAAGGAHMTRNHYAHDFFPGVIEPKLQSSYDWTQWKGDDASQLHERRKLVYQSRQGPRRAKLGVEDIISDISNLDLKENTPNVDSPVSKKHRSDSTPHSQTSPSSSSVEVKCMARTRIPTPHGTAFLHLYHNNKDNKEHMAIVIDPAQYTNDSDSLAPSIRSQSLDAVWKEGETDMDRIIRGAYVGKLSAANQRASDPSSPRHVGADIVIPPPLIRIHSECFTGETVGSMRCDCGEQLDEAIRQISQPVRVSPTRTIPGRGAVIYLRQEGRGIGLLSKIQAYNLQDLGHDTVTANLMLGHQADERGYEIAGAILRDLRLGSDDPAGGEKVRLLTNNPDKMEALRQEGITVVERVPMVPRSWQCAQVAQKNHVEEGFRPIGATLIGGGAVYGEDLDKYIRTKVLRMGHMLPLTPNDL